MAIQPLIECLYNCLARSCRTRAQGAGRGRVRSGTDQRVLHLARARLIATLCPVRFSRSGRRDGFLYACGIEKQCKVASIDAQGCSEIIRHGPSITIQQMKPADRKARKILYSSLPALLDAGR